MEKRGLEHTVSWIIFWATARYLTCLPPNTEDKRGVWFIGKNQALEFAALNYINGSFGYSGDDFM